MFKDIVFDCNRSWETPNSISFGEDPQYDQPSNQKLEIILNSNSEIIGGVLYFHIDDIYTTDALTMIENFSDWANYYFNTDSKDEIIKFFLSSIKQFDDILMQYQCSYILNHIKAFKNYGIDWPELDIIQKSLEKKI